MRRQERIGVVEELLEPFFADSVGLAFGKGKDLQSVQAAGKCLRGVRQRLMLRGAGEDESARPGAQVKFGLDRIEDDGVVAQVIQGDGQDPALP
ncbi:MAG: hypothetical protein ACKN9D_05625 [Actinomycetales bacterium]